MTNQISAAALLARLALAASFLSAVADRFGGFGSPGDPNVAWGDFAHFTAYTEQLNRFAPRWMVPGLAWAATVAEVVVSVLLVAGLFTRQAAVAAGSLLLAFAIAMATSLGLKPPLDYSVATAASAAFLLAIAGPGGWSMDAWRERARR